MIALLELLPDVIFIVTIDVSVKTTPKLVSVLVALFLGPIILQFFKAKLFAPPEFVVPTEPTRIIAVISTVEIVD